MKHEGKRRTPNSRPQMPRWLTPLSAATLIACAALACGCSALQKRPCITVLGDGRKNWYAPGEAVNVPATLNTNGLWLLTPRMLEAMVLESSD